MTLALYQRRARHYFIGKLYKLIQKPKLKKEKKNEMYDLSQLF